MIQLTIWMNLSTAFQAALFRELTVSGEVDLQVIFAKQLTPDRAALGWEDDLTGYAYRYLDERNPLADAVSLAWAGRSRLHIVNGFWAEPAFAAALVTLRAARSNYVIYSEAPEPDLPRSPARKLLRAAFGRLLAPGAAGLLAVSHLAEDFYRNLGAHESVIYPFGYFDLHARFTEGITYSKERNEIEIIYVGQLIHRKGVDLLIEAMRPLFERHSDLSLALIGGGEMMPALSDRVASFGLSERIRFESVIPYADIPARIARADLLVLPSRWDGWGMVVNEAFSLGVPVLVSDHCGSADLIETGVNGYVFRKEDVEDLRCSLATFIERRADWPQMRAAAYETGKKISVETITPYLIECLKHITGELSERPSPSWARLDMVEDAA